MMDFVKGIRTICREVEDCFECPFFQQVHKVHSECVFAAVGLTEEMEQAFEEVRAC